MNIEDITPLILTWDEAPNIGRCLAQLKWARRVVVLDSGSADETVAIAQEFPNVEVMVRPFDDHTSQWNHGLGLIETDWVLTLDADYLVPSSFVAEMKSLEPAAEAYFCGFRYCIFGRPLRGSLYPPRAVLFRARRCVYEQDGHTQRLRVPGGSGGTLVSILDHDDRKPVARWVASQDSYAQLEAEKLLRADPARLRIQDRVRQRMIVAPLLVLFYTLLVKGTVMDGRAGIYYAFQRMMAELLLSLRLLEAYFKRMRYHN